MESDQGAKNMTQTAEMTQNLEKKAPQKAYEALHRFKENSWMARNFYVYAGIHPIRRREEGFRLLTLQGFLNRIINR